MERSQFQKCWPQRFLSLPVGVRSSHDMPCRHRIAFTRWRAASRTQARSSIAWASSRSPSTCSGGTQTGLTSPARASRASRSASRLSFFLERESAELGSFEEATGSTNVSPRVSIRAGTNPVQPLSYTPWDGCGKSAIHSAISP